MDFITAAASASASAADISDNIYSMGRYDTNIFLLFTSGEADKTVTLPDHLLAEGLTYSITNRGADTSQTAKIYPYAGDSFAHTPNTFVTLTCGSTITLCLSNGEWVVKSYVTGKPEGIKKVDAGNSTVSFGDGIVYADASAGSFAISLPEDEGIYGVPLTIIKYDDQDNYVYIAPYYESPNAAMLYGQFESLTVIMEADGTIRLINRYTPDNIKTRAVTSMTTLRGHERFVLADASSGAFTIILPHKERATGEAITVKKTDSSANAVTVYSNSSTLDGANTYDITSQWEYVTFASDGSNWYRVG